MSSELEPETLLGIGYLLYGAQRNLEFATAQGADSDGRDRSQPFGNPEIALRHDPLQSFANHIRTRACDTRHTVGHIAGDGFDGESGCNAQRGNFSVADKLAFLTSTRLCVRIVQFDQTLDQCCSRWKVFQSVGYFVKRHAISDP